MADLNEIIRGDRNFVERIGQLLPGFRGYFDRENRREADRMLRMFGTSKLDEMIAELHELTKAAPLAEKDDVQECVNQAEKLRHEEMMRDDAPGYRVQAYSRAWSLFFNTRLSGCRLTNHSLSRWAAP